MTPASVPPGVPGSKPKKLLDQTRDVLRLKRCPRHRELLIQRALYSNPRLIEHVRVNHRSAHVLYPVRYCRNRALI